MLRRRPKSSAGKYRLYCNLGYNLSEEVVRRYFQQVCTHGQILDVYIPRHNSGRNKGYGFATFETEADLLNALQRSEHVIEGNIVKINRAGPRPDYDQNSVQQDQQQQLQRSIHGRGPRLYVGGITDDLIEDDIRNHFGRWGNVVDIYFPGKSGSKRVNYCFVTFDTWQAAQQACNQSERSINGQAIQSISLAEERTSDGRDAASLGLLGGPSTFHSLPDLSDWAQQFSSLSLQNLQDLAARPQGVQPSGLPDHLESYPSSGAGTANDSLRQHLLQSMQQGDAYASVQPQQAPYWSHGYKPPTSVQHRQSMPGLEGANTFGLQQSKVADSLQSLQQAMSRQQSQSGHSIYLPNAPQQPPDLTYPEAHLGPSEDLRSDWALSPQMQRNGLPGLPASPIPAPYSVQQPSSIPGFQGQQHQDDVLRSFRNSGQHQYNLDSPIVSDPKDVILRRRQG